MNSSLKTTKIINKSNSDLLIKYLETAIGDEMILSSFIRQIEIVQETQTNVIINTKNEMSFTFIQENYYKQFEDGITNIYGRSLKPKFIYNDKMLIQDSPKKSLYVSKKYSFDNYIEADFNREAIEMCRKTIEVLGRFSPLFITSHSGLGKTHLLHATGNKAQEIGFSVCYIEPNRFTKIITNLANQGGDSITNYIDELKEYDILLFDDIQNLGDRSVTLKILFQLLNHFIENDKQIIIVSDKSARELSGFESRFITRFESGLSTKIDFPSLDDLVKILEFKLANENLSPEKWEREALNFIARNNSQSIRFIEGAVKRVVYFIDTDNIENVKYTYQVVSNIFKELEIDPTEMTPNRIINTVANYYKIPKGDIQSKSRKSEIVIARQMAIYFIRKLLNISFKEIGKMFGNRDHSTVMSSVRKIEENVSINQTAKQAAEKIEQKIKSIN